MQVDKVEQYRLKFLCCVATSPAVSSVEFPSKFKRLWGICPSFGRQRECATNRHSSEPTGHGSWWVCVPQLSHPLVNTKHSRHHVPQWYHWRSDAQSRQSVLEVTHLCPNKAEVVWHLYPTNLSTQIRMLGSHHGGYMQDWWSWSVVLDNAAWNQMAPICSQRGGEEDNQAT